MRLKKAYCVLVMSPFVLMLLSGSASAARHDMTATAGGTVTEASAANQLATRIATMGVVEYPRTFADATPTSANTVVVYASGNRAPLLRAIERLPHDGVAVTVRTAPRSHAQLEALTKRIAHDVKKLAANGVRLNAWGPDGRSGTVDVTLAKPTRETSQLLMSQQVTKATSVLDQQYGEGATSVEPTLRPLQQAAVAGRPAAIISRDNDYPPYYAGDGIQYPDAGTCTSAWGTTGNKSGDSFILSAGHCGTGEVHMQYGAHDDIGPVSTAYWDESKGDDLDFETIRGPADGYVWQSGSNDYAVLGFDDPPVGTYMTFNGDVTGERTNNRVTLQDACITVDDPENKTTYTACNVGEAEGQGICHPGDSGGPTYVRNSTATAVYASGTIVSATDDWCSFQEIHTALQTANLSIDTGSVTSEHVKKSPDS